MRVIKLIVAVSFCFYCVESFAGSYELIKGQGIEVCEAYAENLNAIGKMMICEREISQNDNELEEVKFEPIDVWDNRYLEKEVYSLLIFGASGSNSLNELRHFSSLQDWLKYDHITMSIATVDIDNNGRDEKILKYVSGKCLSKSFGMPLIVLNEGGNDINVNMTIKLSQNKFKKETSLGRWRYNPYDIFSFNGENYFDRWNYDERNKLYVYKANGESIKGICSIEYVS